LVVTFVWMALLSALPCSYGEGIDSRSSVVWVVMGGRTPLKKIAPGATLECKLARSVYWREAEIFPQGTQVRMVVDQIESRKKSLTEDDRPFLIHLFAPRHELALRFRSVKVLTPGGVEIPLRATFIAFTQRATLSAKTSKHAAAPVLAATGSGGQPPKSPQPKTPPPWVMTLQVELEGTTFPALAEARSRQGASAQAACPQPCTLADGTPMSLVLLGRISASKDHQGQSFEAELLGPVLSGSSIAIPQGATLEGVVARRVPPRRLYRPASLNLLFTRLALPNGGASAIAASPTAAEVDRGTHMTMDAEGRIHAQNPGKARFLLDFGVTGGLSKVSDDTTQLIIEAISSTATDASTAGAARFAALGASAIYLLTRHGRDVILPPFTEMDISLNRSVSLGSGSSLTKSAR
jgi:hypothetical protein